jgi:hypothetical protein
VLCLEDLEDTIVHSEDSGWQGQDERLHRDSIASGKPAGTDRR